MFGQAPLTSMYEIKHDLREMNNEPVFILCTYILPDQDA